MARQGAGGEGRRFSYQEARALLPAVREITETAHRRVEDLARTLPPPGPERERAEAEVNEVIQGWARALSELGVEVKGLWLADFDNGSGYYCWQYPEPALEYYHSYEDGFQGRIRVH